MLYFITLGRLANSLGGFDSCTKVAPALSETSAKGKFEQFTHSRLMRFVKLRTPSSRVDGVEGGVLDLIYLTNACTNHSPDHTTAKW